MKINKMTINERAQAHTDTHTRLTMITFIFEFNRINHSLRLFRLFVFAIFVSFSCFANSTLRISVREIWLCERSKKKKKNSLKFNEKNVRVIVTQRFVCACVCEWTCALRSFISAIKKWNIIRNHKRLLLLFSDRKTFLLRSCRTCARAHCAHVSNCQIKYWIKKLCVMCNCNYADCRFTLLPPLNVRRRVAVCCAAEHAKHEWE